MNNFGFIMLRHVNHKQHDKFWIKSYDCIRKYYPETPITIIDDSSNYSLIENKELTNTIILNSELPKRAEFLPYYYFLHNHWFDNAIIIHDSVFINSKLDLDFTNYKPLWSFSHIFNKPYEEKRILSHMKNSDLLLQFYDQLDRWSGCFGAMSIISHNYLKFIHKKFDLHTLIPLIQTRQDRMCFERIIACLMYFFDKQPALFGDIHQYGLWDIKYDEAIKHTYLPVIKAWAIRS
jgi:hypothetical protein